MKIQTIKQFFEQFPNEKSCLQHIMDCRYGMNPVCPKCKRETNFSRVTSQRAFACQWCGHHVYPCVGTPFEKSRTSLQLWFYAIYLFTTTRSGVSAKELQRQLGVTYKAAWRMGHEIRLHMAAVDGDEPLSGNVEMDEAYIGGRRSGKRGRGAANKTVLFGMLERNGDIITKVVPNTYVSTLHPIIEGNIDKENTTLHTDEFNSYRGLKKKGWKHKTVMHSVGDYVVGDCHTNSIEGFWSRLKLSIRGTHIHVSRQHLQKYANEFEYRHNSRKNPAGMLPELLSTYQPLTK